MLIPNCCSTDVLVFERERWAIDIDMSTMHLARGGAAEHASNDWVVVDSWWRSGRRNYDIYEHIE